MIKEFFDKKEVKITEGVVIAVAAVGLLLGGIDTDGIGSIAKVAAGALASIEALITVIQGITTKSE